MRKHDLVIFDWNGTLQDDLHHIYECGVQRIFRHFGLPCPTLEEYRHEVAADFMSSFYWPRGIPTTVTKDDLNAIMAAGFKEKGASPGLFADAGKLVEALALRGYPLAVASGYATAKLDAAVTRSGFGDRFFRVVGDVLDKGKDLAAIAAEAGVDAERTAVIGDTDEDVLGAAAIGATAYICTRGFHPIERIEATRDRAPKLVIGATLLDFLPHFP